VDAAQERGEIAKPGQHSVLLPDGKSRSGVDELGITHPELHKARKVRDAAMLPSCMEGTDMGWINAANVNSVGLVLDIIGVLLLFKFGLPESVDRTPVLRAAPHQHPESERRKVVVYDRWSRVGVTALVVGFIFQAVSNYIGPVQP